MKLQKLTDSFSVCKVSDGSQIDWKSDFIFVGKTDEEFSLVMPTHNVPKNTLECEHHWRSFRIKGVLDFSLVGILSKISQELAAQEISIFAISTFNTDYIFVREKDWKKAITTLSEAGYQFQ